VSDKAEPLHTIRALIEQKRYRIRIHAVQHMIKEGFTEDDIVSVMQSGRILENYHEEALPYFGVRYDCSVVTYAASCTL